MLDGIGELRRLAVRYERSRGTSWARIGEVLGIDPAEAERRWGAGAEPAPGPRPEPAQLARELDTWFVRRLWTLEATEAAIADPVTRLLDATGPAPASCLICRKYDGDAVPAWAGRAEPPGGHLVDDGVWRVGHAPTVFSPAGSLLVESHWHSSTTIWSRTRRVHTVRRGNASDTHASRTRPTIGKWSATNGSSYETTCRSGSAASAVNAVDLPE